MNNIKINLNGKIITLYGSNTIIQNEKTIIENLELTGNESKDRLLIQECIYFMMEIVYILLRKL